MIFLFRIGIVLITFQSGTSCGQRAILVHQVTQSKKLWHLLEVWSVYAISCILLFNCSDCMIFLWYSVWFSCIINFAYVWAKQCKIFMLSWYVINYSQKWFPNEILIITTDILYFFLVLLFYSCLCLAISDSRTTSPCFASDLLSSWWGVT